MAAANDSLDLRGLQPATAKFFTDVRITLVIGLYSICYQCRCLIACAVSGRKCPGVQVADAIRQNPSFCGKVAAVFQFDFTGTGMYFVDLKRAPGHVGKVWVKFQGFC
jgi:hypothetical protein